MSARWILNLALLVLLSLVGWVIREELGPGTHPPPLTELDPARVAALDIRGLDGARIGLERAATGWRMREPIAGEVDSGRIEALLGLLRAPVSRQFPAASGPLAEWLLDPPPILLTVDGLSIGIGGLDPIDGQRYVRVGDAVHLIEDRFFHLLLAPPEDYALPPGVSSPRAAAPVAPPTPPVPPPTLSETAILPVPTPLPPDPDALIPPDARLGPPPEIRLSPDWPQPYDPERGFGFGAEPYKAPPDGFGLDPFAPDPAPGMEDYAPPWPQAGTPAPAPAPAPATPSRPPAGGLSPDPFAPDPNIELDAFAPVPAHDIPVERRSP